jgi:hypothetical protein
MFRAFKSILHHANDRARCGRRRGFTPSLLESASGLEDRVLLSAAGGKVHAAEVSTNMANTAAGKEVTNLFESILQTTPTGAQLTNLAHKLHSGMSVKTLRKDLTAEVQAEQGAQAPGSMIAVTMDGDPSASAEGSTRSAAVTLMPPGLSAPTNPIVSPVDLSQVPAGMRFSRSFTSPPSPTSTSGGTAVPSTPTTSSPTATPSPTPTPTPPAMSPTPTPMSPTSTPMSPTPTPMSPAPMMPMMPMM